MTGNMERALAAALAIATLGGCAGHPHGVLMPVATTAPGTSKVAMTVATTREASPDAAIGYSGRRGRTVGYEAVDVSLPPDATRQAGEIQWPKALPGNPATDFVVSYRAPLDRTKMMAMTGEAAQAAPGHRVLVFVHGFNNRYEDAVYRYAQIVHDSDTRDAAVLFTWPSKGSALAYGYDRESSTYSRDRLEELLRDLSRDKRVSHVAILAHSMGNWLTLETLRQMAIRDGRVPAKIEDVILAAPDVDIDVARGQVESMGALHPKFTLFTSKDDAALAFSSSVWGGKRLGAVDATREPAKSDLAREGIAVHDLSGMGTGLNHDTFATNSAVVRAIGTRLAAGQSIGERPSNGMSSRIFSNASGLVTGTGGLAGLAIEGPAALFDPDRRDDYATRLHEQSHGVVGRAEDD